MVLHTSATHLNLSHTGGAESGLNIFTPQMYPMVIATPTYAAEIIDQSVVDRMPWCVVDGRPIINFKSCTLTPPAADSVQLEKRERPKGCKTVFIGRTPENFTDEIAREVFGALTDEDITSVRMSKKNFCHIRFGSEASVDKAMQLSGFRMRISGLNDPPNTGKLHVDFAKARDDELDYEKRMPFKRRAVEDVSSYHRHQKMPTNEQANREWTTRFSDSEATILAEGLKKIDKIDGCVETLIGWLERGECSKRNACKFHAMIQSTFMHAKKTGGREKS